MGEDGYHTREVGLVSGFVINGDCKHGPSVPGEHRRTPHDMWRRSSGNQSHIQNGVAEMAGSQTVPDVDLERIISLGFRTPDGLRLFMREARREGKLLAARKREAKIIQKILRNHASIDRLRVLAAWALVRPSI